MKKILMCTDLSARSDRALQRALMLAQEHQAEVEFLHVVDDDRPDRIVDQSEEQAKSAMAEQLRANAPIKGVSVATSIVRGQDYAEIVKRSENIDADLIVLGVHRRGSSELFRGTTTERVVRLGRIPVLVVKSSPASSYSRVLVAVDLSIHSRRALMFSAELVPNGNFHLVHASHEPFVGFLGADTRAELVRDEQSEFMSAANACIEEEKQRSGRSTQQFKFVLKVGDARQVIGSQIDEIKPDLLVTGTHGRTGVSHAILGSVAEDFLANAPIDTLAVKAW